jgi:hypothetical protein
VPAENELQKLTDIVLTDETGKKLTASDKTAIEKLVDKKMNAEFVGSNTIIINGWIISVTEARQCAIFSFN